MLYASARQDSWHRESTAGLASPKKSYDPVVGKYASPVLPLVDRWTKIFFRIMLMHRNPVAYLLRVAAAPNGLDFGKMRDSTIVCVLRTIRHDNGHIRRAKKLDMHSTLLVLWHIFYYWVNLTRALQRPQGSKYCGRFRCLHARWV